MTPVWMVASGKGGVGKTTIATSFAVGLAERDLDVALVDLDTGLRNVDLLLGVENRVVFDLVDVMDGICSLSQALIRDKKHPHLQLLFSSQIHESYVLTASALEGIIRELSKSVQYVVLDLPPSLGKTLGAAGAVATDAIVVTTGDDVAIRDADRVIGLLRQREELRLHLFVNRVRPDWVKLGNTYAPKVVSQVLDVPLLGYLLEDQQVQIAQLQNLPIIESDGYAWQAMDRALRRLLGERVSLPALPGGPEGPGGKTKKNLLQRLRGGKN